MNCETAGVAFEPRNSFAAVAATRTTCGYSSDREPMSTQIRRLASPGDNEVELLPVSAAEKLPVLPCPQIAGFQLSTEASAVEIQRRLGWSSLIWLLGDTGAGRVEPRERGLGPHVRC